MGLTLQEFLDEIGVTQEEAAEETELSQATISDLCRRAIDPKQSTIMAIWRWAGHVAAMRRLPKAKRLDLELLGRAA